MKNYTVYEVVKVLGFSHQAIRYQIKNNLPPSMIEYRENGAVCVTEEGLEYLREKMGKNVHRMQNEGSNDDGSKNNGIEPEIAENSKEDKYELNEPNENADSKEDVDGQELIALLKQQAVTLMEQLAVKDEQIASQARQIETLVESLKLAQQTAAAAQALHAGTIQKELNTTQTEPEPPQEQPIKQTEERESLSFWGKIKRLIVKI
jgi:hypothetical protein